MKKIYVFFLVLLFAFVGRAQNEVEMADNFRAEGKIYVVVAVVAVILTGIFIYLFRTEARLKKLEKASA